MTRARTWILMLLAGALVLSGCGIKGAYDLPLPGGNGVSSSDGYRITAEFRDVVNVVPRTKVMANDVPVGQVDSVRRIGWHAEVVMTVKKNIVLPANAIADVRQTSLLGEKYIALLPPAGSSVAKDGRLSSGAHIPLSRTTRNPEVEEVLGALSFLLSGGGVGQLKTITTELNKMMNGRTGQIRHLFGQVNALMGSLDKQKNDIVKAMSAVNELTGTLNRERRTISSALNSFGPALEVLNNQHHALMTMLHSLDRLGVVGTRVIRASRANIVASLHHLAPILRKLADAGNSLPRGLMMAASFPFPKQAADLAKGDYSNALFYMNFDLNKILSGALKGGDTGLPNVGQLCTVYAGSENCDQLMHALCTVSKINVFCSPSGPGTTDSNTSTASGRTGAAKKGALGQGLSGLLGGRRQGAAKSNAPPTGLGGLLGGGGGR